MELVSYKNIVFNTLSDSITTLIQADDNTIEINSIIICNLSTVNNISVNLKLHVDFASPPVSESFLLKEYVIPASKATPGQPQGSVDLIQVLGSYIRINKTDQSTDSLLCFSGGYTEEFDCVVNYTTFIR